MGRSGITIVGLLGRAGSGKSSAATHLVEHYGAERRSFAAPLKRLAADLWQFSEKQLYGDQVDKEAVDPRYGISSRVAMQRLGEGARKHIGQHAWMQACLHGILDSGPGLYIVDDVRYVNEAVAIHDAYLRGANVCSRVVKLVCPDAETVADASHPSEAETDLVADDVIDVTIRNVRADGMAAFLAKIDRAMTEFSISR